MRNVVVADHFCEFPNHLQIMRIIIANGSLEANFIHTKLSLLSAQLVYHMMLLLMLMVLGMIVLMVDCYNYLHIHKPKLM